MQNGVIRNKLARVEEYLTKLEEITPDSFEEYNKDWRIQMAAERILQILIETIIDTTDRLIALKNWGPTISSSESIRLLALKKALSAEEPYLKMVKFRNFIVHNYEKVDNAIVYAIITKNLDDIRTFRDEILNYE